MYSIHPFSGNSILYSSSLFNMYPYTHIYTISGLGYVLCHTWCLIHSNQHACGCLYHFTSHQATASVFSIDQRCSSESKVRCLWSEGYRLIMRWFCGSLGKRGMVHVHVFEVYSFFIAVLWSFLSMSDLPTWRESSPWPLLHSLQL